MEAVDEEESAVDLRSTVSAREGTLGLLDKKGPASFDGWRVPEDELYEANHVLRRKLVRWLRGVASQAELDEVMDAVVRVSDAPGAVAHI